MISVVVGIAFLLLLVVLPTLVLYLFIRAEMSNPTVVGRSEAEREAKAQGGLRDRPRSGEHDGRNASADERSPTWRDER